MIDRVSRGKLATALRQYVSGRITNDDLEDMFVDWRDTGAATIQERAWTVSSDMFPHKAEGKFYLGKAAREEIGRWILFLHSNAEYTWPRYRFDQFVNWPMNLLTFGWWEKRKDIIFEEFKAASDYAVWPFASRVDYEKALTQPRYFSRRAANRHSNNDA